MFECRDREARGVGSSAFAESYGGTAEALAEAGQTRPSRRVINMYVASGLQTRRTP